MPYASKGLYLETEAGYYKLSSVAYGFVARIDGSGNFQVLLSDRYFNKTCGLCGNFNIFAEDDFRTQEGKLFWGAISQRRGCAYNFSAHKPSLHSSPGIPASTSLTSPQGILPTFPLGIPPRCLDLSSHQVLELLKPDLVQL